MGNSSASDSRSLREYLAANDAPCPQCRYNLRGIAEGRCPECGKALKLAEVLDPNDIPRSLAWQVCYAPLAILGVIGVFAGALLLLLATGMWHDKGALAGLVVAAFAVFSFWLFVMERRWTRAASVTSRWPDEKLWRRAALHWLLLLLVLTALWLLASLYSARGTWS